MFIHNDSLLIVNVVYFLCIKVLKRKKMSKCKAHVVLKTSVINATAKSKFYSFFMRC